MPKSVVINPFFDWGVRPAAAAPRTHETVIYEAHVKGLTDDCTRDVPEELRGTYAGIAHPAIDRAPHRRSASPRSS